MITEITILNRVLLKLFENSGRGGAKDDSKLYVQFEKTMASAYYRVETLIPEKTVVSSWKNIFQNKY